MEGEDLWYPTSREKRARYGAPPGFVVSSGLPFDCLRGGTGTDGMEGLMDRVRAGSRSAVAETQLYLEVAGNGMFLVWLRVAAALYAVASVCALPAVLYNRPGWKRV